MKTRICLNKIAFTAMFMFAAVFVSACQPTPKTPPIAYRGEGLDADYIIEAVPEGEQKDTGAPAHLTRNSVLADGKVTVTVDIDIDIPEISNVPIIEFQQRKLSEQELKELVGYFAKGDRLYQIPP